MKQARVKLKPAMYSSEAKRRKKKRKKKERKNSQKGKKLKCGSGARRV